MKTEIRNFDFDLLEIREGEDDEGKKIRGHAAVFDKLSQDLGGFKEIIHSGSFLATIKKDDIRALFNHDSNLILGRNKAGTLTITEDNEGLYYEVEPPDTTYANDLMVSIERGDVTQGSFAFNIAGKSGETWEVDGKKVDMGEAFMAMWGDEKKQVVRHVWKARLYDVSPVTYPAYTETDVKIRSIMSNTGLDYEQLACVMVKRPEQFTDEDREFLAKSAQIISDYIPKEPEALASEGADEVSYVQRLAQNRRYLDIAEVS